MRAGETQNWRVRRGEGLWRSHQGAKRKDGGDYHLEA